MKKLIKVPFPKLTDHIDRIKLYTRLRKWFDNNGYIYNEDYKLEWEDARRYVPDFIYCDEELAMMIKLKYSMAL